MAIDGVTARLTRIYGLVDPRDGLIRYVGKTTDSLRRRCNAHVNDVVRGRTYIPRHRWIAALLVAGLRPLIIELDCVAEPSWVEAEQFWIGYLRFVGCDLLNATAGGDGISGFLHSDETRQKQSAAAKRRYSDPAEHVKTGLAVKRGQDTDEYRDGQRSRVANYSVEHLAKFRDGANRWARSSEGRAAKSAMLVGRLFSDEHRSKISAAKRGQKRSPESIEKQRATMRKNRVR